MRHEPATFALANGTHGRNVLNIGITQATNAANGGAQLGTSYNTQVRQRRLSVAPCSYTLHADVCVGSRLSSVGSGAMHVESLALVARLRL